MQARKNQDDLFSKADIRLVVVSEPRVSEPQDFQAPFRNCKNPIPFHALYSAQRIGGKTTHSRLLRITIPYGVNPQRETVLNETRAIELGFGRSLLAGDEVWSRGRRLS